MLETEEAEDGDHQKYSSRSDGEDWEDWTLQHQHKAAPSCSPAAVKAKEKKKKENAEALTENRLRIPHYRRAQGMRLRSFGSILQDFMWRKKEK